MTFYKCRIKSPLGEIYLISSDKGLTNLDFISSEKFQKAKVGINHPILDRATHELARYFKSDLKSFSIPLDLSGTDFQLKVWNTLTKIPFGKTISYAEEAKMLKNPKACRAVGSANGKNPIPIIIPCHRVISSDSKLGGYSGGEKIKIFLLRHEGKIIAGDKILDQ